MGLLDSIGHAVSAAVDTVEDVTGDIGHAVEDVGKDLGKGMSEIGDSFEQIGKDLGPLGDIVDGAMDILSSGSLGGMLNTAMDKLGLPDWVGDVGGGVLDFCTGNWVGAAANGLDALQDVADACGAHELGGFLKAGSKITGMFAGNIGGTGLGEVDQLIGEAKKTVGTIDKAMGGVKSLMSGDIVGAGESLLDTFGGNLGPLKSVVGELGGEATSAVEELIPQGKTVLNALGGALADGKLDIGDLKQLPVGDVLTSALGEDTAKELEQIAGPAIDFYSQASGIADQISDMGGQIEQESLQAAGQAGRGLLNGVLGVLTDRLGADHPDIAKLAAHTDFVGQLFEMAASDPDSLGIIGDLLSQAGGLSDELEQIAHQNISLRA